MVAGDVAVRLALRQCRHRALLPGAAGDDGTLGRPRRRRGLGLRGGPAASGLAPHAFEPRHGDPGCWHHPYRAHACRGSAALPGGG
jgi:hypothetical protein